MTAADAIERCTELRPGSCLPAATLKRWLREEDGLLRRRLFALSDTDEYDEVGADVLWGEDGLEDTAVLLAPEPFDALYPHYLCAMTDASLGETDRYAGEQAQYNALAAELAAWLRRTCAPKPGRQWRW